MQPLHSLNEAQSMNEILYLGCFLIVQRITFCRCFLIFNPAVVCVDDDVIL